MIIVIMIAITGVVSVCLIVAIVCVRRKSNNTRLARSNRSNVNGFHHDRSLGDGAEGSIFPIKAEQAYNQTGYLMGISPTPSDLDALKLTYQSNIMNPSYLDNSGNGIVHTDYPDMHLINWSLNSNGVYYPERSMHPSLFVPSRMTPTFRPNDVSGNFDSIPPFSLGNMQHDKYLSQNSRSPNIELLNLNEILCTSNDLNHDSTSVLKETDLCDPTSVSDRHSFEYSDESRNLLVVNKQSYMVSFF